MKKTPLLVVLAFLVLAAAPVATDDRYVSPIQPLQEEGLNNCTAWAINKTERLWATAKHCIRDGTEYTTLGGAPINVAFIGDGQDDVVLIQSEVIPVRTFKLAKKAPPMTTDFLEPKKAFPVIVKGFPFGVPKLITTYGVVSARLVNLGEEYPVSDILDVSGGPGNSGSPVFNKKGEVIGLLWGGMATTHILTLPWETLNRTIGKYVEVK